MDFEVWTKADAEILLTYIDVLVDSLYGLREKSFEGVMGQFPSDGSAQLLIAEIKKAPENARSELLREIREEVKSYEVMKLTVAVKIDRETAGELVREVRKKWPKLVIEFEVKPEIIGGAKVFWRGRYFDKSLEAMYDAI